MAALYRKVPIVALVVMLAAAAIAPSAAQQRVPASGAEIKLTFAPLVKKVAPAVVNIFTRKKVAQRRVSPLFNDPFFRRFFGGEFNFGAPRQRVENSLGSGVIIDREGLIVTNQHVIEGADEITVVLADRREFDARIVGADKRTDLAVLRIDPQGSKLPFLTFRDSDELEVGDLVLAIGNPFGVGQTVTSGIISAVARTQVGINDLDFFIQTDAAINPGNSGGALVSLDGKLAGINTAIFSKNGGSVGIGFAIPANMVQTVIRGVAGGGRLVRPWLGARAQGVTAGMAASLGLDRPVGVLLNAIHPDGPAAAAGLKVGDIIVAVAGREINDAESLRFRIATKKIGEKVKITVRRRGKVRRHDFSVEAPPERPARAQTELSGAHPLAGAMVANLSPALADELDLDLMQRGVIILQLRRGGSAHRLQFHVGDIVDSINGTDVTSVRQLKRVLVRRVAKWRVVIRRDGEQLSMVINR